MRILHVTPYWADAWAYGGIPRVVGAFAKHLAAAGHHVTVCATDAGSAESRLPRPASVRRGSDKARSPWAPIALDERIELRVFPNRSNRLAYDWQWFTPVGLGRYLRDHARDFDVAHLHACRNLPGAIAAHYLHRYGVPYVLAPNGTAAIIERRRLAKHAFDLVAGRSVLEGAAAVIAVSSAERRQLRAMGVPESRIALVPNPIDLTEFAVPIERGRFRRRVGLGAAPLVVFLGKITPRKRLDVLARAFARLRADAHLVIAGNDMGGLVAVRSLLGDPGLESRTHFTGLVQGRERLEVLADADVVAYPSDDEAFGLVPLEAMLVGAPVVVTDDSGCGEVVGEVGGGIVVTAGSDEALADAMSRIVGEPDEWRQRARAASDNVRRRYGATHVSEHLSELYARVVGASPVTDSLSPRAGVSFVVPVKNGLATIARTIASIESQADGRPLEIIAVDDRSGDGSREWLAHAADHGRVRLMDGGGHGASAAMNLAIGEARFPIVCQVDQDVELLPGWLPRLIAALERDPRLGAVQGQYTVDPAAPAIARAMALDLEQRYQAIADGNTDHVCTGNTAFRAEAVRSIGGFDERLGYASDNDISARLREAGWRLGHCRQARSFHRWRDSLAGYCRQQYGFGYGRLDFVRRDRRRVIGDRVSSWSMMAHPIVSVVALASLLLAAGGGATGGEWKPPALLAAVLVAVLATERTVAGIRAYFRFGDRAALLFPVLHSIRNLAWVVAIVVWLGRRATARPPQPSDSMQPRPLAPSPTPAVGFIPRPSRTTAVIPAHNEAATIAAVIEEIRQTCPGLDVLVVDDGSTDGTAAIASRAGVRWLRLPERLGVGSAMRAGLRYAQHLGYDAVVRLDGDGQHAAADVGALLAPLDEGRADVVLGSRFLEPAAGHGPGIRWSQRALAGCLSLLTSHRVTDPTSGFCAVGPRAMRLLVEQHPTGYPEAEMRLLLGRHSLGVVEVAVGARPRLGGRTSLTTARLAAAGARVALALLIVPIRRSLDGTDRV